MAADDMPEHSYSLYVENKDGRLFGPPLMVRAVNDDDAVAVAASEEGAAVGGARAARPAGKALP